MRLLEVTPAPCTSCGRGNTTNNDGTKPQFVDLERDVNWNDPVIFCEDCVTKMAALIGMLSTDARQELQRELRDRDKTIHELGAEIDGMKRRAKRLGITFEKAAA